jgi:transcriptional regulator with XRE-family HTH domain
MATFVQPLALDSFPTFGDLLKYLRRRERLTQLELSIAVGYSEAQISRLEKNQRLPDLTALKALFLPALHIEKDPAVAARLLELGQSAREEDAPTPGMAPYKGLLFFDEPDAEWFFGREALTERLCARVMSLAFGAPPRLLAVVGASGSGKSSLVRAGLAVALKRTGWDTRVFTPTAEPLKSLGGRTALANGNANTRRAVWLVDQFEEVFTLSREDAARAAFVEQLLAAAHEHDGLTTVVIALRADFYSHCAQFPRLREAIANQQEFIGQMSEEELRRAIEDPAKRGGWEFEPGLVDAMLRDIGAGGLEDQEPGALPLLSHALLATWERRRGRTLTLDGYRASGGVRGAIAETAESVFVDRLDQQQRHYARDIFLRLTELGEGTEDTRRRAALTELVPDVRAAAELRAVLNTLADARLVILGEDSAEVAHEALIREWQRLREWLHQDRDGLRLHRQLTQAAREWEALQRDHGALYRGARLAQTLEWAAANANALNAQERAFLDASKESAERDAAEREVQRRRELEAAQRLAEEQRRRAEEQSVAAKRLRQRGYFLASAFVLAIVLAGIALFFGEQARSNAVAAQANERTAEQERATAEQQRGIAEQQRLAAEQASRTAFSRELTASALANLDSDPDLGLLLALQAVSTTYSVDKTVTAEAESALHRAVLAARAPLTLRGHTDWVQRAAFSPDGTRIGTVSQDGSTRVWDSATGRELLNLSGDLPWATKNACG